MQSDVFADVSGVEPLAKDGGEQDYLTVSRTAAPYQQKKPPKPQEPVDYDQDFIDTLVEAAGAVSESASNTASRIQEAVENGNLWDVSDGVADFSGRILQMADAIVSKGAGSGIGCTTDPIEMNTASLALANEALAGISRSVEAAVDAVSSHFVTQKDEAVTALTTVPVVKQLQPKVEALVDKAEKGLSQATSRFVVDDNQMPESVMRRGDAAVAAYKKRAAEAAARATSPRVPTDAANPGTPKTPTGKGAMAPNSPLGPASPAAAASPRLALTSGAEPASPNASAAKSAEPASPAAPAAADAAAAATVAAATVAVAAATSASPRAPEAAAAGPVSPSAAKAAAGPGSVPSSPKAAVPSSPSATAAAAMQGPAVRAAMDSAACLLNPLQQLAVASKQAAAAASKNIAEAAGTKLESVKSWASMLPSSGAAAVAALEKLRLPVNQVFQQQLQAAPAGVPAVQNADDVVAALRDRGHEAAASGDAVSAVRFYTAAMALAPDNHLLRYSRANALLKLGKTTEATRDALVLVRVMPVWSSGWGLCAQLMEADGNFQEAIALYNCAKQIAETNEEDDAAAQKFEDAIERLQERGSQHDRP